MDRKNNYISRTYPFSPNLQSASLSCFWFYLVIFFTAIFLRYLRGLIGSGNTLSTTMDGQDSCRLFPYLPQDKAEQNYYDQRPNLHVAS